MTYRAVGTGLAALLVLLGIGCGSDDGDGVDMEGEANPNELDPNVNWEAFRLVYPTMYSAYDGEHTFSVPVYANNIAVDLEGWQAIPSDAVTFSEWQNEDGSQKGVLITIDKYVEKVTIAAKDGTVGGTAELFITEATPDQWELGKERYIEGADFDISAFMSSGMFNLSDWEFSNGMVRFVGDADAFGTPTDLRCDTCHTAGAENFQIQHTPTQVARFSDEELITIFTEGKKPEGEDFRVLPGPIQSLYEYFHTWEVTDEQVMGLVVYLRSLTPEGQGDILLNTGGFAPPGGTPTFPTDPDPMDEPMDNSMDDPMTDPVTDPMDMMDMTDAGVPMADAGMADSGA